MNGGGGQGQEPSGRGGLGGSGPGGARRSGSGLFNLREMGDLLNNSQVKKRYLKENMLTLLTLSKTLFAIYHFVLIIVIFRMAVNKWD